MAINPLSRVPCDARTWITRHRRRFFPLISLSDSVPLPLTSYPLPLPCPVTSLSRPGVLVAYTLLRATGGCLSGSYLGTIWDIFGGSRKVFFERQCVIRYSEVNPMKYSLFHQPCMHQLQHPMQWSPVQLLHAISKQCPVHAMKCSQLKWRAIPEL